MGRGPLDDEYFMRDGDMEMTFPQHTVVRDVRSDEISINLKI